MDSEFTFSGTLISGPDVDLVALSGLQLSDADEERLWESITRRRLLLDYLLCEEIKLDEIEGGPGNSDSLFEYRCGEKEAFVSKLRNAILDQLKTNP